MKISVLASGSKGNSSYIETKETKILIDMGMSSLYIEKKLEELNINPKDIDGIIITHTHADHVNGLKVFLKKYNTKLYVTEIMYKELIEKMNIYNYQIIDNDFSINDINITVFKTSHDAADSNGYVLESSGESLVYITDTGYINRKHIEKLLNKNLYVMESNHDIELLMNGKYPYYLKQRILGDRGHLSNKDSSDYLSKFIGENTDKIILIHLSEENNREEVALRTLETTLVENNKHVDTIIVAKQNERTELVEV